jgi:putative transposase
VPNSGGSSDARSCSYLIVISPRYVLASVIGFLKRKSAIAIAGQLCGKERNFTGEHFWAQEYAVSTIGFEIEQIQYIRDQEEADVTGNSFKFGN